MTDINCPKCERIWPEDCEQGLSVKLYEECVVCKFSDMGKGSGDGTQEELTELSTIAISNRIKPSN